MSLPKWKRFEELVGKVQRDFCDEAKVTLNDKVEGKITGTQRQIDISIRQKVGQFDILIAIDCKDLASPVDVKGVEEVIGLIQDVGAHKGVIVSANGFTSTALIRGEKAGLDLLRLVDCGDHDWKAEVSIPVVCDCRRIKTSQLRFFGPPRSMYPSGDPFQFDVYDEKNKYLGRLKTLLEKKWSDGELPGDPGEYDEIDFIGQPTKLNFGGLFVNVKVTARLVIERNLYFGYLPLVEVSGFQDDVRGELILKQLTTDVLNLEEVEKTWKKIDAIDALAITPVITGLFYDYYCSEEAPDNM
jgi:hypothetical protein